MIIKKEFNALSEKELSDMQSLFQDAIRYEQLELTPANPREEEGTAYLCYLSAKKRILVSVLLCYDMEDYLEITAFTAPKYRCQGYFTSLLQALMEEAGEVPVCIYTDGNSYDALVTLEAMECEYNGTEHMMRLAQRPALQLSSPCCIDLQPADETSLKALSEVHSKAFPMESEDSLAFLSQAMDTGDKIWCIRKDCAPIGLVITSSQPSETCLYGLAIDPAFQKQGYATAAVALLCEQPDISYPITLHVTEENEAAYRLYRHLGFVSTQELMEYWY